MNLESFFKYLLIDFESERMREGASECERQRERDPQQARQSLARGSSSQPELTSRVTLGRLSPQRPQASPVAVRTPPVACAADALGNQVRGQVVEASACPQRGGKMFRSHSP